MPFWYIPVNQDVESQKYNQLKLGAGIEEQNESILCLFGGSYGEAESRHLQTDTGIFYMKT